MSYRLLLKWLRWKRCNFCHSTSSKTFLVQGQQKSYLKLPMLSNVPKLEWCLSKRLKLFSNWSPCLLAKLAKVASLGRVRLGYSGIRIYSGMYSGIYSGYSAPGTRIARMEIQVFQNENSSQTNAYSHYSNYSYSGLIPNEGVLSNLA